MTEAQFEEAIEILLECWRPGSDWRAASQRWMSVSSAYSVYDIDRITSEAQRRNEALQNQSQCLMRVEVP